MPVGSISPSISSSLRTTVDAGTVLKRGSTGESVKQLQQQLAAAGFDCGKADGVFGARTEAAVIAFQKANGCTPDGKVGPKTLAALNGSPSTPAQSPDVFVPSTGTPSAPGALRRIKQSEVTPAITKKAMEIRDQYARPANYGMEIPFEADGKQYVARIEQHYHPPGGPMKPWGYHAGVSIFAPT